MKHIYFFLLLLPSIVVAQTTHPVDVGGSTAGGAAPYYAPQDITIDVGDIVHWTSSSGTHNVNGSIGDFPENPEGFFSGQPVPNLDFAYTFNIPGVYHYHCDQQGHSTTQFGSITVVEGNSVEENEGSSVIALFPVPTDDVLVVELGAQDIRLAEIHSLDGRLIKTMEVNGMSRIEIPTTDMVTGQYYVRLTDVNGRILTRPFRKE